MPCTLVDLPGNVRAIVCTRGRRPRCVCGARPSLQCDAPAQRKSGTCDKHLCAKCATEVGPDRHLCPAHAAAGGVAAPAEPEQVQEALFP